MNKRINTEWPHASQLFTMPFKSGTGGAKISPRSHDFMRQHDYVGGSGNSWRRADFAATKKLWKRHVLFYINFRSGIACCQINDFREGAAAPVLGARFASIFLQSLLQTVLLKKTRQKHCCFYAVGGPKISTQSRDLMEAPRLHVNAALLPCG